MFEYSFGIDEKVLKTVCNRKVKSSQHAFTRNVRRKNQVRTSMIGISGWTFCFGAVLRLARLSIPILFHFLACVYIFTINMWEFSTGRYDSMLNTVFIIFGANRCGERRWGYACEQPFSSSPPFCVLCRAAFFFKAHQETEFDIFCWQDSHDVSQIWNSFDAFVAVWNFPKRNNTETLHRHVSWKCLVLVSWHLDRW